MLCSFKVSFCHRVPVKTRFRSRLHSLTFKDPVCLKRLTYSSVFQIHDCYFSLKCCSVLHLLCSSMSGPNSSSEWSIEGRRLVPLMPRLVPQTAFTATANAVASATANQNASLPLPAETGNKEGEVPGSPDALYLL